MGKNNTNERINYNFKCGIKAFQEELTLGQDKQINELIRGIGKKINDDITKLEISHVLNLLFEEGLINKLLNIILNTENLDYSKITNSELEKVITDFFSLNPALKRILGIGAKEQAG